MRVYVNNVVNHQPADSVKKFAHEFRNKNIGQCGFTKDVEYKAPKKEVNFYRQPELAFAGHPSTVKPANGLMASLLNLIK